MGKVNDADIDAMLKMIQDNVQKQAEMQEKTADEEPSEKVNTPDELLDMLEAHVGGAVASNDEENAQNEDVYDISGFEIEADIQEETVEAVPEIVVEAPAEEDVVDNEVNAEASEEITEETEDVSDVFVELTAADEYADEAEGENNNEEEVRKKVEQFVNDTVDSTESLIFFENFDRRSVKSETNDKVSEEIVPEEMSEAVLEKSDEYEEEGDSSEAVCVETLEPVTELFEKIEDDENIGLDTNAVRDEYKTLDDYDINFALSLGNKDALELAMGFVKVRAAKHNFVNPKERPLVGNVLLENRRGEYKNRSQNADIKDEYRKEKKRIGKRLLFTSLILLAVLFCEIVYTFDKVTIPYVSEFLSVHLYYGILSVVLLASAIAVSYKKLFGGFVGFFTANANYYTTAGFVTFINVLYSLLVLIVFMAESLMLMTSVCVFSMVMCIVGEYMQIAREMSTFELVSDERPKISLERVERTAEMTKKESFLRCNEFYIDNTNFVGRYFERSARRPEIYHTRYTLITLTMLVSLLVAVAAVVMTRNFSHFIVAVELAAVLCVPVQFVLLGAYQFYVLSKKLQKLDSAIIGETIADEYVGNNTIYLDDVEVFGNHGVKIVGLEPHNSFNIVDVNYYFLSVFSSVNGPLKNAFGPSPEKLKLSDNVKLLNVFDGGIEAMVDNKSRVLVGTAAFLKSRGVLLGRAAEDKGLEKDATCAMYLSVNNALCAKLYLKYTITHRFEAFSQDMSENRALVGIRTIDPNITEEMIALLCDGTENLIRVIRPTLNDLVPIGRRADSGIITAKNPHMIAKILAEGLKIKKINSLINVLWIVYAVIGISGVIATSVFGVFGQVIPVYIILYQLLWTACVAVYIRNKLRNRKTR